MVCQKQKAGEGIQTGLFSSAEWRRFSCCKMVSESITSWLLMALPVILAERSNEPKYAGKIAREISVCK
ncbi:hypothetical protein EL06_24300 [Salmonella enterica subsp. diarizonae]|uniref:Uncharacterized protein n=1 Tax=Salmonella diarizonae TaxID=59204 RepID=A0A6C8Y1Y4_SALDZ|nr:hypothetical protein [Salmonella enterica subsp. diarizonae]